MGTFPHWPYFLAIEEDLKRSARFVTFHKDNMNTYSVEFAQIILRAGAETEVVARHISGTDKGLWPRLRQALPELCNRTFRIHLYDLTLTPWSDWKNGNEPPSWWDAYTAIKHDREQSSKVASLSNALHSTAGLLALILERAEAANPQPWLEMRHAPRLFEVATAGGASVQQENDWQFRIR